MSGDIWPRRSLVSSSPASIYASAVAPIMADGAAQATMISDGGTAGVGGDYTTASSDFGAAHDGLVTDSSAISALNPPDNLKQFNSDLIAALDTCAQGAGDAQTAADNIDAAGMQTASDELASCTSQLNSSVAEFHTATGR